MFAPNSNRNPDTAATIPGPSGQDMRSRAVWSAPREERVGTSPIEEIVCPVHKRRLERAVTTYDRPTRGWATDLLGADDVRVEKRGLCEGALIRRPGRLRQETPEQRAN